MKHPKIGKIVVSESALGRSTYGPIPSMRCGWLGRLALLHLCTGLLLTAQMIDGSALITSRSGEVRAADASGAHVSARLHQTLQPNGLSLSTDEGQIFVAFSNGVALGLDAESEVKCIHYTQSLFDQDDQILGREPSVSKLLLQFDHGQIAIASNRLSPLSELRIQLNMGELRLHKGSCLIRYDLTGIHITAVEGSLTYYYPESDRREFISAFKGIRISEQSAALQQVAETFDSTALDAATIRFCQAAQHASKRVTFQANPSQGQAPIPVLIVSPQYFKQPAFRPYQFQD